MIVGLYFNLFMAKKPLSWHEIGLLQALNKTNFGIKLLFKLIKQCNCMNSKLKTTIDLDRCVYTLVVLHQSFIKAFKGICEMF